jgi:uracil-DNA glycosylase
MQDLHQKLEACHECTKLKLYCKALKCEPKACIQFNAYKFVESKKITNLFLAEAPPPTEPRYFYNTEIPPGGLRRGLFKQLGINNQTRKGLEEFCKTNFLTDTIKCRLNKEQLGQVPSEIINNCVNRFLREEIEYIKPKNIIALGDTARRGLAALDEFKGLNGLRIKKDCGKKLSIGNYNIVLYAYPSTRNTPIFEQHPLTKLLS